MCKYNFTYSVTLNVFWVTRHVFKKVWTEALTVESHMLTCMPPCRLEVMPLAVVWPQFNGTQKAENPPKHALQIFLYIGFPELTELKSLPAKLWREFYLKS